MLQVFAPGILESEQFVQGPHRPVFDMVVKANFLLVSGCPINMRVAGPGLSILVGPVHNMLVCALFCGFTGSGELLLSVSGFV